MTPEETSSYFNKVFNAQHSRISGRSYNYAPAKSKTNAKQFNEAALKNRVAYGAKGSSGSSNRKSSSTKADRNVAANLNNLVEKEDAGGLRNALSDLWGGAANAAGTVGGGAKWAGGALLSDQAGGVIKRSLDLISRPGYGVFESLRDSQAAINEGQQPWETLDDAVYGAGQGLAGFKKTGFGKYVEEAFKPDSETNRTGFGKASTILNNPLGMLGAGNVMGGQALEQAQIDDPNHGILQTASRWNRRIHGLAGEVGLDPLNVVGGAVVTNVASTARHSGNVAENLISGQVKETVSKAIRESVDVDSRMFGKGSVTRETMSNIVGRLTADKAESLILEIKGGAQAGRTSLGGYTFIPTVSNWAANEAKTIILRKFEARIERLKEETMPAKEITDARRVDPLFDEVIEGINRQAEDMLEGVSKGRKETIDDLAAEARKKVDEQVVSIQKKIIEALADEFYNSPAIRVGNKKFTPPGVRKMGRAYRAVNRKGIQTPGAFSFARQFPGRSALINQRAKSLNGRQFEAMRAADSEVAKTISREERVFLHEALINRLIVPEHLEDAFRYLKTQYEELQAMEVQAGVRTADDFANDYAYTFIHAQPWKSTKNKGKFKTSRKEDIASTRKAGEAGSPTPMMGPKEAKALGLSPEEDAFSNLVFRRAKANRDLTRAAFTTDLVDHYGVKAKIMGRAQEKDLGLVKMDTKNMNQALTKDLKADEAWYLPEPVKEMTDFFDKLSTLDFDDQALDLFRTLDWALTQFKFAATLPWAGFHFRNMVGDVFMGLLDGVNLNDYKVAGEMIKYRFSTRKNNFLGKVGKGYEPKSWRIHNVDMSADQAWTLYKNSSGSGGFTNTDLNLASGIARNKPVEAGKWVKDKLVNASEGREDLGRFAHFFKALRDEAPGVKNFGSADPKLAAAAMEKAVELATYRVNKYKFDYGALTASEKQYMRRLMPFYTYTRKAIPTLIESLFMSPQYMALVNRQMGYTQENEQFGSLAPWQKEAGMLFMSGGEEPYGIGANILPTGVLGMVDQINPENPLDAGGIKDTLMKVTSMGNPFAQAVVEIPTDTNLFSGNPLNLEDTKGPMGSPPILDYLAQKLIPPYSVAKTNLDKEQDLTEFLTGSRLALGLGTTKLRKDSQSRNLMSNVFELDDRLKKDISPRLKPFGAYIFVSKRDNGTSIRVRSIAGKKILFDGDLQGALDFIKSRYGV